MQLKNKRAIRGLKGSRAHSRVRAARSSRSAPFPLSLLNALNAIYKRGIKFARSVIK